MVIGGKCLFQSSKTSIFVCSSDLRKHLQQNTPVIKYEPPYLPEKTTEFREKTGIALPVSRDGRIRLSFDLPWLWEYEAEIRSFDTEKDKGKLRKALESKMEEIEKFYNKLCDESGDFYILDINLTNQDTKLATYRPGPVFDPEDSDRVGRLVLMIAPL
jgi:hypothetical protein